MAVGVRLIVLADEADDVVDEVDLRGTRFVPFRALNTMSSGLGDVKSNACGPSEASDLETFGLERSECFLERRRNMS